MHSFKTAYGNIGLAPGFRYYFEVKFLKGSNFKLGVSRSRHNLDIAFSDDADGWAYYSNGQLRHNSKGDGPKYGEIFRGKDSVGVYIDLIDVRVIWSIRVGTDLLLQEWQDFRRCFQRRAIDLTRALPCLLLPD